MARRPMDTDIKNRMSPPLGIYTIVSILRGEHQIVVQNENIEEIVYDKPDIVGISITVDVLPQTIAIANRFQEQEVPVVAGGVHVTTAYDTIPSGVFDVLCIGAAESTWPQIMKDLAEKKLKPIYSSSDSLSGRDIVTPAYDLMPYGKYLYRNIIHTSRGCPFKCDFCYNSGNIIAIFIGRLQLSSRRLNHSSQNT